MTSNTAPPGGQGPDDDDDFDRTVIAPRTPKAPPRAESPQPPQTEGVTETSSVIPEDADLSDIMPLHDQEDHDDGATIIAPLKSENRPASDDAADSAPAPIQALEPGMEINNMYRVENALNQGGMGRVFRGVEISTGDPVAIKVILPEIADDDKFASMFKDEARTLRQLHHDAIVRYFSYFPPNENVLMHALVMDFIEGNALSDHLKQFGALSVSQCCTLFARLADGLSAAHAKGVIHRDLSPDNVMLTDGDITRAVLIDFGIAQSSQIKESALGDDFAGKLKYASPEQLEGSAANIDARSDIYSLALLLIATCTGTALPMGKNFIEAQEKRKTVPELGAVPFEFRAVLQKMLQPSADDRFHTMGEVKAAMEAIGQNRDPFAPTTEVTSRMDMQLRPTEGLQAAPMMYSGTAPGGSGLTNTITGVQTQTSVDDHVEEDEPQAKGGGLKIALVAGLVVAALGAAGVFLGPQLGLFGDGDASSQSADANAEENGGPSRLEGSREAFLAETLPQGCLFATLRQFGPNAGKIEAFSDGSIALGDLLSRWSAEFGAPPTLLNRAISAESCATITLARQFQGTEGSGMELALRSNEVSRQDGIVGVVHGSSGRSDWLGVVTPEGRVFALTQQFEDPIGDERRFSFRMPSAEPGTYLIIAISSEKALVRTAAMQNGTLASDLFGLIGRELSNDSAGAVDVGLLQLGR